MKFTIIKAGQEPNNSHAKQGFVYIVKPVHANVYKIGETDNLDRRLVQLKKKFDFDLEYVYTTPSPDCFQLEQRLHMRYSKYHIGGDWFALTEEALQDVVECMAGVR